MLFCALTLSWSLLAATPQDPAKVAAFTKEMNEAIEVGDTDGMTKAMRKYKEDAILLFLAKAPRRAVSDDPELNDWVDLFITNWNKAFRNDFARNYDRYLQRLGSDARRARLNLIQSDYPRINKVHIMAVVEKNPDVIWADARANADSLVRAFEDLGDLYYLALAHNIAGNLNNPMYKSEGADGQKAVDAYQACLDARERLDLTNDKFYGNTARVVQELRAKLGIEEPVDPNAPPPEEPEINPEEMQPTPEMAGATATVEAIVPKKIDSMVHSADFEIEQYESWIRMGLPVVGEQITLPDIMPPIRLLRISGNTYQLEAGAEPTDEFRLTGKPQAITVMRKFANGERPYTLEVATGTSTHIWQGVTLNLEPTDQGGPMFMRPMGAISAETPYGQITLVDFSGDGAFGAKEIKPGGNWAEGLLPETWFLRPDAILFGKTKHSWPYSRFFADEKGQWYELTVDKHEEPSQIQIQPVTPTLGQLKVNLEGIKKLKLASLLLVSDSSATKGLVIDLAAMKASKGTYSIPIGRYRLLQGRLRESKDGGSVLMLPDPILPTLIDIRSEEMATLDLGAPFTFQAGVSIEGTEAVVNGRNLHLLGKSGERYLRFIGEPLFDVDVSAKGAKAVSLEPPLPEDTNKDWERLYYPMDAVLTLRKAGEKPEITLSLKKHPWFGKISSTLKSE